MSTYENTINNTLRQLYEKLPENLEQILPAGRQGDQFLLEAFGENCVIEPGAISIGGNRDMGALGIPVSLYALHAKPDDCIESPFKAFRELQNSMPYVGAFATHTEKILIPHINKIEPCLDRITKRLGGEIGSAADAGDFSFRLRPFPKIVLNYIFYRADDDFPAAATCLFSNNAQSFLPIDALADTGEYTSKKIIELVA
jgi:hypothetical protein